MIKDIEKLLENIFVKLNYNKEYAKISFSKLPELCDFQINSVFYLTKELGLSPEEIGNTLIKELESFTDYFESVEFCKLGFINLKISDNLLNKHLNSKETIEKKDAVYFLDYGGPNIAKPLHVGHLRSAIIGESFKRILKYGGYKVISDVHLGDYGLQIGQVIYGLKQEKIDIKDISLGDLEKIYPAMSKLCKENEEILKECQKIVYGLQKGNTEYELYWKKIYEVSGDDIKNIYKYLNVSFDLWEGEKDSFEYIPNIISLLNEKKLLQVSEGAKVVDIKENTDTKEMPPAIIEKSDGAYLYATTDLAAIYERIIKYNPNYILYFTDERQSMHFEQVFRVAKKLGFSDSCSFEHNFFGTVNGLDGKPFKTRSGGTFKLKDLLIEAKESFISKKEENKSMSESDISIIVNSIIKYADLQNNREKNYIFDINKFSDTIGKTGPYILYSAIRIRKILNDNLYEEKNILLKSLNKEEKKLKLSLLNKNSAVLKAIQERMPHYIADYLYDLSVCVNAFYQTNNIANEKDVERKNEWLNILSLSYETLKEMLDLLAIDIPTKM